MGWEQGRETNFSKLKWEEFGDILGARGEKKGDEGDEYNLEDKKGQLEFRVRDELLEANQGGLFVDRLRYLNEARHTI